MIQLVIRNVTVVSSQGRREVDVMCRGGKIVEIGGLQDTESKVVDGTGLFLLPGVIDAHVHFRDPGLTHKEDFRTGSMAAVRGGVTTVFDMPNTKPPTYTLDALEEKRRIVAEKSLVNYGFYFGATGENVKECEQVSNVAGLKVVLSETTAGATVSDPKLLTSLFGMKGNRFTLHAEGSAFDAAVEYLLRRAEGVFHIAHVNTRLQVDEIRRLKDKGVRVTCEVAPHHLFLSDHDRESQGAFASMKPSLMGLDDQEALWDGLTDGTIDLIASDHAPHTKMEKLVEDVGFVYGVPGVENSLRLMLDAFSKGRLSLERLVWLMSERPAEVFGLKSKGRIEVGMDADLTLVDLHEVGMISNSSQVTKCGWTPYNGWRVKGDVVMTMVDGEVAYRDGVVFDEVRGREVEFKKSGIRN